jgi:hypothetical protein
MGLHMAAESYDRHSAYSLVALVFSCTVVVLRDFRRSERTVDSMDPSRMRGSMDLGHRILV